MSVELADASPSGTVTVKQASLLPPDARRQRCRRVAERNLLNTLRILRHCQALGIKVYRFSSRLVPLATHPLLEGWDYAGDLSVPLQAIGAFVKANRMRVSFHPDHFNVLTSEDKAVRDATRTGLEYHVRLTEAMGLGREVKLVLHLGGGKDKVKAIGTAQRYMARLPDEIQSRITLENDDKVFTAGDVLVCVAQLGIPVVLDAHHERSNPSGEGLGTILPRCFETWQTSGLPPKLHLSSPAGAGKDFRAHHDWIDPRDFLNFWPEALRLGQSFDVMVEAKRKDGAVVRLKKDLEFLLPGTTFDGFSLFT